jgi:hypothetical protein
MVLSQRTPGGSSIRAGATGSDPSGVLLRCGSLNDVDHARSVLRVRATDR